MIGTKQVLKNAPGGARGKDELRFIAFSSGVPVILFHSMASSWPLERFCREPGTINSLFLYPSKPS